jgi:adenylate cyclase
MHFEIERKFLLRGDAWRSLATGRLRIRQAYLAADGRASIRVRITDDRAATLTIKSRGAELRRLELEYAVPVLEAEALMPLRRGSVIEKVRHLVPEGGGTVWEIDEFAGDNAGLVIGEIELEREHQFLRLPPWVGAEVTGQAQYYNSALSQRPFALWSSEQARSKRHL